jgi:catechol 2,3-dioxygenase-like lactoylglutathione lyase family enzyme
MQLGPAVPILRIYSYEKAIEFYVDFLGFRIDWEFRYEPGGPVYMQVSRDSCRLHLSEHYGDGTPGSHAYASIEGVDAYSAELLAKRYRNLRPGVEVAPWNARVMMVIDPFNNRISFNEPIPTPQQ